ncbi:hypothetical protein H4R24_003204 [Coemansia sp. RSA 988]|nr:hypothetical protein H4R24_003204 [Coemansia sp. RSA 988]
MVKFASTLLLATIFGAFANAQPVGFELRNYNEVNADNNVVVVTVTKTLQPGEKAPEQQPQYAVKTPVTSSAASPKAYAAYQTQSATPTSKPVYQATSSEAPQETTTSGGWHDEMLSQLNSIRAEVGKGPVSIDQRLQKIAQAHSEHQSIQRAMTHADSQGSLSSRYNAKGINWQGAAENIAWNQPTVSDVMKAWKNSDGHYANMIGDYNYVGFGVANLYWTQDFLKA